MVESFNRTRALARAKKERGKEKEGLDGAALSDMPFGENGQPGREPLGNLRPGLEGTTGPGNAAVRKDHLLRGRKMKARVLQVRAM